MNSCPECGKETWRKFCSNSCSNKFNGRKRLESNLGDNQVCITCGEAKPKGAFSYNIRGDLSSGKKAQCKKCGRGAQVQARRARNWTHKAAYVLWRNSLQRSKRYGIEHTIQLSDIVIPETCPVLGIPLFREDQSTWMNAPSLDRIINTKGYIPSNVIVISRRANILKRDATILEMVKLAEFYSNWEKEHADLCT